MSLVSERSAPQQMPGHEASELERRKLVYVHDAAHYAASLIAELRQIAGNAGLDKLVRALDSAYYEAYAVMEPPNGAPQRNGESGSRMNANGDHSA
jgi:hypothetical protein